MPTDGERFSEMLSDKAHMAVNIPTVDVLVILTDDSQLHLRRLADGTAVVEAEPSPKGNLAAQAKNLIRELQWTNPYRPRIIFTDGGSWEFPVSSDPTAIVG